MLSIARHHLGDSWYFVDGDHVHCFFLVCPDTTPHHWRWSIGHATSENLRDWSYHGIVLESGPADGWDGICLATGSLILWEGRFWMAYTGNWFGPQPAVGLAVSTDLYRWRKIDNNPITKIDESQYTATSRGQRRIPHWRDPFLLDLDGTIHQLVCATARNDDAPAGAIGVAASRNMVEWEYRPPLEVEPFAEEMECPQIVSTAGRHYLIFSTPAGLLLSDGEAAAGSQPQTLQSNGNLYCQVGESPLGPFRVASGNPILPPGDEDRPYACRVVRFRSAWYLLGTVWSESGDRISDPIPIEFTPDGPRI